MNKIVYKLTTAVSTAALLTGSVASVAFGTTTVTVTGNGADSTNTANVSVNTSKTIQQTNTADIENNIDIDANTGNNEANKNTGGDVSVKTGDANVSSSVSNSANSNAATLDCGGCPGDLNVKIAGNGANSENTANTQLNSVLNVYQTNTADVENNIDVDAKTGGNEANKNTGGDVSIETGDADVEVSVENKANFNGLDLSDCDCVMDLDVKIAGNGADSENKVNAQFNSGLVAAQSNEFDCDGGHRGGPSKELNRGGHDSKGDCAGVDIESKTGGNEANKNTGEGDGDPSVETGDAGADVEVSTEANSNVIGDLDLPDMPELPDSLNGWIVFLAGMFHSN
jgi:hypothetical protein